MVCSSVVITLLLIGLTNYVGCEDKIGTDCTIKNTNEIGKCKLVQDCPEAIKSLASNRVNLQICGFQGSLAIVCCVSSEDLPPSESPTINTTVKPETDQTTAKPINRIDVNVDSDSSTTDTTTAAPILKVGDKSKAKCLEYKQYVFSYPVAGAGAVDECKAKTGVPLIIGGELAIAKEFPHMVLIGFKNGTNDEIFWLCGGSLISERFVLTAGHCLKHTTYQEARYVRLGDLVLDTDTDDASPQEFRVVEWHKHPNHYPPSKYNDIGLLKLDKKAILNSFVRPACLDTQPALNFSDKPIVTGWGDTGFLESPSKALLKVTLEYFTHEECTMSYGGGGISLRTGINNDSQICAGSHKEEKDACQGDSGGPLQVMSRDVYCMYSIVGVTSFGKTCGVVNVPGVYTRVANYIEWIENIVWP